MAEEESTVASSEQKGETPKTVPLGDFITFKKASSEREKKLKGQLEETNQRIAGLEKELRVARLSDDDDAIRAVKQALLEEKGNIDAERDKLNKEVASYKQRAREARVKQLAKDYSIEESEFESEEDFEGVALRIYSRRLSEENEKLKKQSPKPNIYESTLMGSIHKQIKDMDVKEFAQYEKGLKEAALTK